MTAKSFPAVATVVFDLDGALIHSLPIVTASLRATFAEIGLTNVSDDVLGSLVGPPLTEGIRSVLVAHGRDSALATDCVARYRALYAESSFETPLQPGILAMLDRLRGKVTLAIATSKPRVVARPIVERLGLLDRFAVLCGPELDAPHESKGRTLSRALDELHALAHAPLERAHTIMAGDRMHDIAGAREAGVYAVAVTWGYGSREELAAARPDATFDTPETLAAAILRGAAP